MKANFFRELMMGLHTWIVECALICTVHISYIFSITPLYKAGGGGELMEVKCAA